METFASIQQLSYKLHVIYWNNIYKPLRFIPSKQRQNVKVLRKQGWIMIRNMSGECIGDFITNTLSFNDNKTIL